MLQTSLPKFPNFANNLKRDSVWSQRTDLFHFLQLPGPFQHSFDTATNCFGLGACQKKLTKLPSNNSIEETERNYRCFCMECFDFKWSGTCFYYTPKRKQVRIETLDCESQFSAYAENKWKQIQSTKSRRAIKIKMKISQYNDCALIIDSKVDSRHIFWVNPRQNRHKTMFEIHLAEFLVRLTKKQVSFQSTMEYDTKRF